MQPKILRSEIIRQIRQYFWGQGFIETDTPSLVLSPGMETHIRPIGVRDSKAFLPTSPEFAMKKILAQGVGKIFQICKAYRLEPKSTTHNPEFAMLEWYRANAGYEEVMDDVEGMFVAIAKAVHGSTSFETKAYGRQDVSRPWPRLTIEECFRRFAGIELAAHLDTVSLGQVCRERGWCASDLSEWDDLFFLVMMNAVEPGLAKLGKPAIVHLYPESQAALSNLVTDSRGLRWAKRFEVYAGGLELGNAFDELTDARVQRARFEKDMGLRARLYGDDFPPNPIDEEFLTALERMPRSGGIAMGVDRLAMYFTGTTDIKDILWGESYFQ